jgi:carbon monoxide dehydrogenase subunit G
MARVELSLWIDRPPEEVYAYLTDLDRIREWQPATQDVRVESAECYVQVMRMMGKTVECRIDVAQREPPRCFAIRTRGGPVDFSVVHTLEGEHGGTRLRVEGEGEATGVFRLGGGVAVKAAEQELRRSFERLKKVVEGDG